MIDKCSFCKETSDVINKNTSPYPHFVIELETGYVSLGYRQYYKGYCVFICKEHGFELHKLPSEFRKKFLYEMTLVSEAVDRAFKPKKINYELLGNSYSHLHWHIFPRYKNDPKPKIPVWSNIEYINYKIRPTESELLALKNKLLKGFKIVLKK
jgi:diadenosine tetraphosphate (Ap4A) HIT family hydrolase